MYVTIMLNKGHYTNDIAMFDIFTVIPANTFNFCQDPGITGGEVAIFLPHDATQSVVMLSYIVCLSVCPSVCLCVTFRYRDYIGWNSSKIISRPSSLRP